MSENTEQNGVTWEEFSRSEINALLDIFLPDTESGNIGIKYIHPVKAKYETHTVYDEDKVSGVEIRVVFKFSNDLPVIE